MLRDDSSHGMVPLISMSASLCFLLLCVLWCHMRKNDRSVLPRLSRSSTQEFVEIPSLKGNNISWTISNPPQFTLNSPILSPRSQSGAVQDREDLESLDNIFSFFSLPEEEKLPDQVKKSFSEPCLGGSAKQKLKRSYSS